MQIRTRKWADKRNSKTDKRANRLLNISETMNSPSAMPDSTACFTRSDSPNFTWKWAPEKRRGPFATLVRHTTTTVTPSVIAGILRTKAPGSVGSQPLTLISVLVRRERDEMRQHTPPRPTSAEKYSLGRNWHLNGINKASPFLPRPTHLPSLRKMAPKIPALLPSQLSSFSIVKGGGARLKGNPG
ncbi:hypothetical protein CEXT_53331 [Caerostris extrusa]|uniref:Uncharacterized protein n=1 Tax=Caerostris extrusa TaxID=172846 RepID=A0AAV4UQZ5_CAEEX|nr:hypothetical protein CEXT_53331 [Caerostris extrusa]